MSRSRSQVPQMQSSQNQTLNMLIDEIAIPDDVVVYFQEALSALPDQATQTQFSERFGYLNAG